MELTLVGWRFSERKNRGQWDLAYKAKMPSGKMGVITRFYEFNGRDTISDEYRSSASIADEVKSILADNVDRMDIWDDYFPLPRDKQGGGLAELDAAGTSDLVLIASY